MNLDHPLPLLGNQSPNDFMRRYWQTVSYTHLTLPTILLV